MKVLFIGNSFTYYNDMPMTLASLIGADNEVKSIVKGGYYLSRHLDADDALEGLAIRELDRGDYDFVVLQDQSFSPIKDYGRFERGVVGLSAHVKEGASVLMYATWAYKDGSEKLAKTGLGYEEMRDRLYSCYKQVGDSIGAQTVPCGYLMYRLTKKYPDIDFLSVTDSYHPAPAGSLSLALMFSIWLGFAPNISALSEEMKNIAETVLSDCYYTVNEFKK